MFQPPLGKPWLLYGILGSSLLLNLVMVFDRDDAPSTDEAPALAEATADGEELVFAEANAGELEASVAAVVAPGGTQASTETLTAEATPAAPVVLPGTEVGVSMAGWQVVDASLERNLAATFKGAVGEKGSALSQVYARLFVWDLDLRRDLQPGDRVQAAWRVTAQGKVEVGAARLHSQKHGRTYTAYRWHAPEDAFASYWADDGTEVPYRLVNSPLRDYEQITSLLKDRPTHEGMDFKTPVGTPIHTPFGGVVTRVNWNWGANGNCVEVKYADGSMAKFLHLSDNAVSVGQSVASGDLLGKTGNTGRSTAPHLHYQIEKNGKVLDPLKVHGAERRRLAGAALTTFVSEAARLDALLDGALAMR